MNEWIYFEELVNTHYGRTFTQEELDIEWESLPEYIKLDYQECGISCIRDYFRDEKGI